MPKVFIRKILYKLFSRITGKKIDRISGGQISGQFSIRCNPIMDHQSGCVSQAERLSRNIILIHGIIPTKSVGFRRMGYKKKMLSPEIFSRRAQVDFHRSWKNEKWNLIIIIIHSYIDFQHINIKKCLHYSWKQMKDTSYS